MYKLFGKIIDTNIEEIVKSKIDFSEFNDNLTYDIHVDFYNIDLEEDLLNDDVSYEIKREHYLFIKKIRNLFEDNKIKIQEFFLMGTISELDENEINISILKSSSEKKKNTIWPCKEIFLFEDRKNKLDLLLFNNQISEEDYQFNLEYLKDELNIYENEEDNRYIN